MGRRLWLRHLTGIASGFAQKTTTPVTKNPTHPVTATGRWGRIPLASTKTMRRKMQCLSSQQRSRRRRHHWPRHCGNDTSSKLATAAGFVLDRGASKKKVNVRYRLEMNVREKAMHYQSPIDPVFHSVRRPEVPRPMFGPQFPRTFSCCACRPRYGSGVGTGSFRPEDLDPEVSWLN